MGWTPKPARDAGPAKQQSALLWVRFTDQKPILVLSAFGMLNFTHDVYF